MNIISLNVNGIRASLKKGLMDMIKKYNGDIVCLNEVKAQNDKVPDIFEKEGYQVYWNDSHRKGYAGTGILIKNTHKDKVLNKFEGVEDPNDLEDKEGRCLTLEFEKYYLVNVYVPNSGMADLKFKERRINWNKHFNLYIQKLLSKKEVIMCGDFNVAIRDIDVYDGDTNKSRKLTAGFTDYERFDFKLLLEDNKLEDVWLHFNKDTPREDGYTFWSWRGRNLKENNKGWRIDYFLMRSKLLKKVKDIKILQGYKLSDHCPLVLTIKL